MFYNISKDSKGLIEGALKEIYCRFMLGEALTFKMSDLPLFKLEEVSKHKDRSNCWIVIEGHVYDVGRFLDEHPGGEEVILELAGMDATEGFDQIGHSDDARDLLKTMLVGHLDASAPVAQTAQKAAKEPAQEAQETKGSQGVLNS